jgi:hypothetical protein
MLSRFWLKGPHWPKIGSSSRVLSKKADPHNREEYTKKVTHIPNDEGVYFNSGITSLPKGVIEPLVHLRGDPVLNLRRLSVGASSICDRFCRKVNCPWIWPRRQMVLCSTCTYAAPAKLVPGMRYGTSFVKCSASIRSFASPKLVLYTPSETRLGAISPI